jgi:hypothetical protein
MSRVSLLKQRYRGGRSEFRSRGSWRGDPGVAGHGVFGIAAGDWRVLVDGGLRSGRGREGAGSTWHGGGAGGRGVQGLENGSRHSGSGSGGYTRARALC